MIAATGSGGIPHAPYPQDDRRSRSIDDRGVSRRLLAHLVLPLLALAVTVAGPAWSVTPASAAAPTATLSPSSGPAGSSTTLTATGLPRSAAALVTIGLSTLKVRTDRAGRLVTPVAVPALAIGDVRVAVSASGLRMVTRYRVTGRLRFGVSVPGGPGATEQNAEAALALGEVPSIEMFYRPFGSEIATSDLDAAAGRKATPLLTWEPWNPGRGVDQPDYRLSRITAGEDDSYVLRTAQVLRAWGKPVLLRFAHEMNGDWYPWCEQANGNQAGDYAAAWRHVHDLFVSAGAANVAWVWSPNVSYAGSTSLASVYPGDAFVDLVALDGYNWGTTVPWHSWTAAADVFGPTLAELRSIAPRKPLFIAETASTEVGGDKAAWIRNMFTWLSGQPNVEAVVWFDYDKETDWRVNSSSSAAEALRQGLAART